MHSEQICAVNEWRQTGTVQAIAFVATERTVELTGERQSLQSFVSVAELLQGEAESVEGHSGLRIECHGALKIVDRFGGIPRSEPCVAASDETFGHVWAKLDGEIQFCQRFLRASGFVKTTTSIQPCFHGMRSQLARTIEYDNRFVEAA